MSESGRAEEESERKTDEKKEDDQKMEGGEVDIEAKAPGTRLDDGRGVGDLISHFTLL